jgi:hypothetical protein|tara:strand:- start:256 stop:402 length:147 start_codon:yes stop_codon:yes gene_type:complete
MKRESNKQFSTVRKLTNKVKDLEKRCEEIELIMIAVLENLSGPMEKKL